MHQILHATVPREIIEQLRDHPVLQRTLGDRGTDGRPCSVDLAEAVTCTLRSAPDAQHPDSPSSRALALWKLWLQQVGTYDPFAAFDQRRWRPRRLKQQQ